MTNHIENIKLLLTQLDNCFYNNIDTGLIQHPELCAFAVNMENIITGIKYSLTLMQNSNNTIDTTNIDYSQLQELSTKDR